ncbi:zinc finger BED domain-containing protein 4-like [Dysidea avara]|uniref:zinc finger BED domain-containing protein 4-like n=1 Tax=Dysidea avara TaxID=196820 RepID=UPI003327CA06
MIALDNHLFSLVEDVGFLHLMQQLEPRYSVPSRKYVTEVVIPRIAVGLTNEVQKLLKKVVWFSFTTDIWSTDVSSDSLLSLTAHWFSDLFERRSAILHAEPILGSHTGEVLCEHYKRMLAKWKIKESQVHLMVRDNAANMIKAMKDGSFPDLGCFAHTLQLIVHDGVLSQKIVIDTVASARCIVSHFKRSPLAYGQLKEIQQNLQLPVHCLKRDEPTRWNSTLYMLQVLIEQKMALAAYASEYCDIVPLTSVQLDIATKVVKVLGMVARSFCTDAASVSLIIPFIRAFQLSLEQADDDDRGVKTMKKDMLASLNRRYKDVESHKELAIATLLDPQFKDKFFY